VRSDFAIRNRISRRYSLPFGVVLAASATRYMHASTFMLAPDCSTSGDTLKCYLSGILNFLDVAAVILGILLIGVIVVVVRIYRKTKGNGNIDS
jgi:hypothetical protein